MTSFSPFYLLLSTALLFRSAIAVGEYSATNDTNYILTNCETTLYPVLCYTSLAGYASAVQQDPARLARVAIGVSLSKARKTARFVFKLSRQTDYEASPRAASALHDCFSVFGDAIDQIRDSLDQMRSLGTTGQSLRFELSNVQTYMSSALTNEETCTDGFEDVPTGSLSANVYHRVVKVKEVTSNALALVNSYASKIITP